MTYNTGRSFKSSQNSKTNAIKRNHSFVTMNNNKNYYSNAINKQIEKG